MWFKNTVSKDDIQNFVKEDVNSDKSKIVKQIQEMKENTISRLKASFSQEKIKFIDPMLIKWVEKEYFSLIKDVDWKIDEEYDYSKSQKEIEKIFKNHDFDESYIWKFENISDNKLLETPRKKLIERKKELLKNKTKWPREYNELKKIDSALTLLDTNNINNTKARNVLFDKTEFKQSKDKFNIQCFYEQDKQWNKNYFSINELLNDLETFGVESGYPKINISELWSYWNEFHTVQKFIKVALLKNILEKYRDYQEVAMYDFQDNEKHKWAKWYENKTWILAEKVVEWSFRDYANLDSNHDVNIKKASIGEDQAHKVDLIIQIKDKKTWINIEEELQLTVNTNNSVLQHKRKQINRQKDIRDTNLDLLELELNWLTQKTTLWRNMDRPIWWLNSLLSIEDKEFMKKTYNRLVEKLDEKVSQKVQVKKLNRDDKAIAA